MNFDRVPQSNCKFEEVFLKIIKSMIVYRKSFEALRTASTRTRLYVDYEGKVSSCLLFIAESSSPSLLFDLSIGPVDK